MNHRYLLAFALLYSAFSHTLALASSNTPVLILDGSSKSSATLGIPPEFTMQSVIPPDRGSSIKEIDVLMNVVAAMEDLCFRDQDSFVGGDPIPGWPLPQYNLYIDIVAIQARYAGGLIGPLGMSSMTFL